MKCSELIKGDVVCCHLDDGIIDVAAKMRDRNIGFLAVCDPDGVVRGAITDRDLAIRALADARPPHGTRVSEVMTTDVVRCRPGDELQEAERLMSQHHKSRIVVVDERDRPVGVISLSDIAEVEQGGRASAVLRSVAARGQPMAP